MHKRVQDFVSDAVHIFDQLDGIIIINDSIGGISLVKVEESHFLDGINDCSSAITITKSTDNSPLLFVYMIEFTYKTN